MHTLLQTSEANGSEEDFLTVTMYFYGLNLGLSGGEASLDSRTTV